MDIDFRHKANLFPEIRNEALAFLATNLDVNLCYHSHAHTVKVEEAVTFYGTAEKVSENDVIDLRLAAIFHDSGYIRAYTDNEVHSVNIMTEHLSSFKIDARSIERISSIIMATRQNCEPINILEKIICDADHDYFGTEDYKVYADQLYIEKLNFEEKISEKEWLDAQIDYLKNNHEYYTNSAIYRRAIRKQEWVKFLEAQRIQ